MGDGRLLTYAEAAEYLGVKERTVRTLWEQRRITAVKIGRNVRFRECDLDVYAAQHLVPALRKG